MFSQIKRTVSFDQVPVGSCDRCGRELMKREKYTIDGHEYCAACAAEIDREKWEKENGPLVYLIREPASHGEALLDTLLLYQKDGKPTLLWCVSWRGGVSHASGAGDHVTIPEELLQDLTAESLIQWMLQTLPEHVLSLADFSSFAQDERVRQWCEKVRTDQTPGQVSTGETGTA